MGSNIFLVGGAVVFLAVFLRYFCLVFLCTVCFFSGMKQKTTKLMMSGYGQLVIFDILYDSRTMHVH